MSPFRFIFSFDGAATGALLGGLLATMLLAFRASAASPLNDAQQSFFETRIRPVLATECYRCHGAENQKAGLRLDYRDGLLKGGESGPAVKM